MEKNVEKDICGICGITRYEPDASAILNGICEECAYTALCEDQFYTAMAATHEPNTPEYQGGICEAMAATHEPDASEEEGNTTFLVYHKDAYEWGVWEISEEELVQIMEERGGNYGGEYATYQEAWEVAKGLSNTS